MSALFTVRFTSGVRGEYDAVAAFTGYRPDNSFLSELQTDLSAVSEGPARFYRAISSITDCLSLPRLNHSDLESGEPGFYFAGSKSYGRAPTFLLQSGFQHLGAILDTILGK